MQQNSLVEKKNETLVVEKPKPKTIKLLLPNGAGHVSYIFLVYYIS